MQPPQLKAEFLLDENGHPKKIEGDKRTHYEVKISIAGTPKGAYGVTYRLHPTYLDPVREVLREGGDFSENITTYGDYELAAKIRTDTGNFTVRDSLADALTRTYGASPTTPIANALQTLKKF